MLVKYINMTCFGIDKWIIVRTSYVHAFCVPTCSACSLKTKFMQNLKLEFFMIQGVVNCRQNVRDYISQKIATFLENLQKFSHESFRLHN